MRTLGPLALALTLAACSSDPTTTSPADAGTHDGASPDSGGADSATSDGGAADSSGADAAADGGDVIAKLLALTTGCKNKVGGDYATDVGQPENIPICGLNGAVYWNADMDIDCDGKTTATCSLMTDPAYQNMTSGTDSMGNPLDAASLPYVVVPLPSSRFDYGAAGLTVDPTGSVILVLYKGQLAYGIFGDEGPDNIIGEASVAMANLLGIDSNPATGGVDTGVTYIAFTGASARVTKNEDHAEAVTVGQARLAELLKNN